MSDDQTPLGHRAARRRHRRGYRIKNRIKIYGPKDDGTYVEFRTAEGNVLAIFIPRSKTAVP